MRQLDELRTAWKSFLQHDSLDDLRNAVRTDKSSDDDPLFLRSAYWKAFLFFESNDHQSWPASLSAARSAYDALHKRFNDTAVAFNIYADDPLADGVENKWLAVQDDDNLRAEITQDIIRLPDDDFLRRPDTQKTILSILFVFCKLNPDLSYRQGMHELLAPILSVVEADALTRSANDQIVTKDATLSAVFDASFIEHDAFTLFSRVMQNAKNFYEHTSHRAVDNPLILRSRHITEELLPQADPELSRHLERIAVPPQLYLMRWLRLLFGREFDRRHVLSMWDIIFAEDVSMDVVNYICVVMLLRIRWELLSTDYNTALPLLLRYSAGEVHAQTLAVDALRLRDRLTPSSGRRLIAKYSGRSPLDNSRRSITPPPMQRNITTFSGVNALKSAWRGGKDSRSEQGNASQPSNLETLLQNTARNLYDRGEQLGIGKAVRTAVDDIHRRAQKLRDLETPSPSSSRYRSPRAAPTAIRKLEELEKRNQQLATLLEHATARLWAIQKQLADSQVEKSAHALSEQAFDIEELSIAVGKVQYVQLHLQDSTLRLADLDLDLTTKESQESQSEDPLADVEYEEVDIDTPARSNTGETAGIDVFSDDSEQVQREQLASNITEKGDSSKDFTAEVTLSASLEPQSTQPSRPHLADSAYSWMLGQNEERKPVARSERPHTLFGE